MRIARVLRPSRVLPLLAFSLVAFVAPGFAAEPPAPAEPALVYPVCGDAIGTTSGPDLLPITNSMSVVQPLPAGVNLASAQPALKRSNNVSAQFTLVEWDPVSLVPDAGSVALRTRGLDQSALYYGWTKFDFVPPVVTRSLAHVADAPRTTTAWIWRNTWTYSATYDSLTFSPAGSPEFQPARFLTPVSAPVPGGYPVMGQTICTGDAALQALRVAQAVGHPDGVFSETVDAVAQRVRVPEMVRVRWIEFAVDPFYTSTPWVPGTVALLDAQGPGAPPLSLSGALVAADFVGWSSTTRQWLSHNDFDQIVTLQPGHDYWLVVAAHHNQKLLSRSRTGTEPPDYAAIGECYTRAEDGQSWTIAPSQALVFRVIGEPVNPVGAPAPRPLPLALRVSPNPVRGEARIACSGMTGGVRVEVVDVRGRRVGEARLDAASAAGWTWHALDADGAPLPAGVYFVRVADTTGREGVQRVVLVR